MKTFQQFERHLETVPLTTSWYLADLGEARGRQELFTRQSPQKLKVLREHAIIESAVSSNRIEGVEIERARVGTVIFGKSNLRDRDEEEVRGEPPPMAYNIGLVRYVLDSPPLAACPNPIDCTEFFVRRHYLDFLGREPDPAGFAFWTSGIDSCGADAQCAEVKRGNVSAAFFLSIEFQETGFLAYKTYGAAFGTTHVGATVPLTLAEFLPDLQRHGRGVVVGTPGWEAWLEENKTTYFEEFVERADFVAAYSATMSATQYADALNANANGVLSAPERDQLVADLTSGAKTRAGVLRAVAEDADFTRAQFNRAFALMQYFGYLKRDPERVARRELRRLPVLARQAQPVQRRLRTGRDGQGVHHLDGQTDNLTC